MSINGVENRSVSILMQTQDQLAAELGGDVNAQVAAMLLKHSQERKSALREERQAQEQLVSTMEARQVAKMRESATEIRTAAQERAIGQIANGACQIAGGCVSMGGSEIDQAVGEAWKGTGASAEGVTSFDAAEHDYAKGMADADAKQAEHLAGEASRGLEDIKDDQKSAHELVRTALDFLKEIRGASDQSKSAALFQRV